MGASAPVKYHYFHRFFYLFDEAEAGFAAHFLDLSPRTSGARSESKTVSGGEFGWGGTSVK